MVEELTSSKKFEPSLLNVGLEVTSTPPRSMRAPVDPTDVDKEEEPLNVATQKRKAPVKVLWKSQCDGNVNNDSGDDGDCKGSGDGLSGSDNGDCG
ncbi:hypothetical protein RIF29_18948 [Crotalaria pallida]|uniref:Uncharacterized protein n=1 Tax=Crotalaria pallida TaxID=3830 RepID=A0AAN9I7A5_CROPI